MTTELLLVGGSSFDISQIEKDLKPYKVSIPWQWQTSMEASRKSFPSRCKGVLVFSKACSHDLYHTAQVQAKAAGVPIAVYTSKTRSLAHLKEAGLITDPPNHYTITATEIQEVLDNPTYHTGTYPESLAPTQPEEKTMTTPHNKIYLEDLVPQMYQQWLRIPDVEQHQIRQWIQNPNAGLNTAVRTHLMPYKGMPKHYMAFMACATQGPNQITVAKTASLHKILYDSEIHYRVIRSVMDACQKIKGTAFGFLPPQNKSERTATSVPPITTPQNTAKPTVERKINLDDLVLQMHDLWTQIPAADQMAIQKWIDVAPTRTLPPAVSTHLLPYAKMPQHFIALMAFITQGNIPLGNLRKCYRSISGHYLNNTHTKTILDLARSLISETTLKMDITPPVQPTMNNTTPETTMNNTTPTSLETLFHQHLHQHLLSHGRIEVSYDAHSKAYTLSHIDPASKVKISTTIQHI